MATSQSNSVGLTIDNQVPFLNAHVAVLSGNVSTSAGITKIELFDGTTDLGTAKLGSNGAWYLSATLPTGTHQISAQATDANGQTTTVNASFTLHTGLPGRISTEEDDYNTSGQVTNQVFTQRDGQVAYHRTLTQTAQGNTLVTATNGTYFDKQPFYSQQDLFTPNGTNLVDILYNRDGTHDVTLLQSDQTVGSIHNDTFAGTSGKDTFVFSVHPGHETLTNFDPLGSVHDQVSLSAAQFSSVADILNHLHKSGNDAVLTIDKHDSITFQNVSVAELRHNSDVFSLHA